MKNLLSTALLIAALSSSTFGGIITTGEGKTELPPPPPPAASNETYDGESDETDPAEDAAITVIMSVLDSLLALP